MVSALLLFSPSTLECLREKLFFNFFTIDRWSLLLHSKADAHFGEGLQHHAAPALSRSRGKYSQISHLLFFDIEETRSRLRT